MDLREFYAIVGGDYDEIMNRLLSEERIKKYLLKFTENKDYDQLGEAMSKSDIQSIFSTTHNIKGMGQNLGLANLTIVSSELCELVRGLNPTVDLQPYYERITAEYEIVINAINALD